MWAKLQHLLPQPTNWFSKTVEYVGKGKAYFTEPKGYIEGEATCQYDETGNCVVDFKIVSWKNASASDGEENENSLIWLITGDRPDTYLGGASMYFPSRQNHCTLLEITISDGGNYRTENPDFSLDFGLVTERTVTFTPFDAEFLGSTQSKENAYYWVVPLLNFVSAYHLDAVRYVRELRNHPLRLRPLLQDTLKFLESDASEEEKLFVLHHSIARSYLIPFEYYGDTGFIEFLPDYLTVQENLSEHKTLTNQTAVMVGKTLSRDELQPIELVPILGLATGCEVGAAWIEFRNEKGELVWRSHHNFGRPLFKHERHTVHEVIHKGGVGKLLTSSLKSSHFGKTETRVALWHVARIFSAPDMTLRMYHIFTALDLICGYYNIISIVAPNKSHLNPTQIEDVEDILNIARDKIVELKNKTFNKEESDALNRIAEVVKSAPLGKNIQFADKVVGLLKMTELKLQDLEVVEHYYVSKDSDIEEWKRILNFYRNATAHEGYYSEKRRPNRNNELKAIALHLHDILVRVLLRMMLYDGEYAPCQSIPNASEPVDWVKPGIFLPNLGYQDG